MSIKSCKSRLTRAFLIKVPRKCVYEKNQWKNETDHETAYTYENPCSVATNYISLSGKGNVSRTFKNQKLIPATYF
jgi:hypothetical protein